MQCEDLDQLRLKAPVATSWTWPPEAQEHLASCGRCSQLQAVLDSAEPADFPKALQSRIEAAILPVSNRFRPLPSAWRCHWCLATLRGGCGSAGELADRGCRVAGAEQFAGLCGFYASRHQQPGPRVHVGEADGPRIWAYRSSVGLHSRANARAVRGGGPIVRVPLASPLLAAGSLLLENWGRLRSSFAPLFWLVLRRGCSLNPVSQGMMTGLLAGIVGVTVLEIHCPNLDRMHIVTGHLGAAVTAVLVAATVSASSGRFSLTSRSADSLTSVRT